MVVGVSCVTAALASINISQDVQTTSESLRRFLEQARQNEGSARGLIATIAESDRKQALEAICINGWSLLLSEAIQSNDEHHFDQVLSFKEMFLLSARYGQSACVEELLDSKVCKILVDAVFEAAKEGHTIVIQELLRRDQRLLHYKNSCQESLMHVAVTSCKLDLVTLLHRMEHPMDAIDWDRSTPLHLAALNGFYEGAQFLIKNGYSCSSKNNQKNIPLHFAARDGHSSLVTLLVTHCLSSINAQNESGMTPLMYAAASGYEDVVRYLLDNHADMHFKDNEGETPLHKAIASGHITCTQLLLQRGASVFAKTNKKWTVLHFACRQRNEAFLREVLQKIPDLNEETEDFETALHFAVIHATIKHIGILLQSGASAKMLFRRKTPTIQLIYEQKVRRSLPTEDDFDMGSEQLQYDVYDAISLCLQNGAHIDECNENQQTLLHLACEKLDRECVNFCLKNDANRNVKAHQHSPLHIAVLKDDQMLARMLLDSNAEINIRNKIECRTPLLLAISSQKYAMAHLLLDYRASPNTTDLEGKEALHVLCESCTHIGGVELARRLLDAGADAQALDAKKETPLHLVNERLPQDVVAALIANVPCIDYVNARGETPLSRAYQLGRLDLILLYLANGADPGLRNNNALKPIEMLALKHTACLQYLLSGFGYLTRYFAESKRQENLPKRYLTYGGLYLGSLLVQLGISSFFGIPLLAVPFAAMAPSALAVVKDMYSDYHNVRRDQDMQALPAFVEDIYDCAVEIDALLIDLRACPELLIQEKELSANPLEVAFILGDFVLMQKLRERLQSHFLAYKNALIEKYPKMNRDLLEECSLYLNRKHMTDYERFTCLCDLRNSIVDTIASNLLRPIAKQKALHQILLTALTQRLAFKLKKLLANILHLGDVAEPSEKYIDQGYEKILDLLIPVQHPSQHEAQFLTLFWSLYTPQSVLDHLQRHSPEWLLKVIPYEQFFTDAQGCQVIRRAYLKTLLLTEQLSLFE